MLCVLDDGVILSSNELFITIIYL
uniref:Uncharacterized protein n=1 Tax=Anguilla anguilla TaxID=7936 RepID=A0A0E9PZ32_ANGAN